MRIPDCPGPERVLEISGNEYESLLMCLESAVPFLYECPDGVDDGEEKWVVTKYLLGIRMVAGGLGYKLILITSFWPKSVASYDFLFE